MEPNNQFGTIELNSPNTQRKNGQAQDLKSSRKDAERILYKITTFSIFHPTTIIIDAEKISVIQSPWRIFHKKFPMLV